MFKSPFSQQWYSSSTSYVSFKFKSGRAEKSIQDKQALGVIVSLFIMHSHAIVFILEPQKI